MIVVPAKAGTLGSFALVPDKPTAIPAFAG